MVIAKHSLDVPRIETTEFRPSSAQVDEAVMAMHGLRQLIRHGDTNKLSSEVWASQFVKSAQRPHPENFRGKI